MKVLIKDFVSYKKTIPEILKEAQLQSLVENQKQILIKPNLTLAKTPPTTTPVELIEEIVKFLKKYSRAKIIIAEGSGGDDTKRAFEFLGYDKLAKNYQLELIDLNKAKRILKENPRAKKLKKVALPEIAFESFIINVPVLKEHDAAKLTAAMKNVFGFYLNSEFIDKVGGIFGKALLKHGWWNKSELHFLGVNETIFDLNNYIKFSFNIIDGSVGQRGNEIDGSPCLPPLRKIIAGDNPQEVDIESAKILGIDPETVKYLNKMNGSMN